MSLSEAGCHENSDILTYIPLLMALAQVSILSWHRQKLNNKFKKDKNYGKNHWY